MENLIINYDPISGDFLVKGTAISEEERKYMEDSVKFLKDNFEEPVNPIDSEEDTSFAAMEALLDLIEKEGLASLEDLDALDNEKPSSSLMEVMRGLGYSPIQEYINSIKNDETAARALQNFIDNKQVRDAVDEYFFECRGVAAFKKVIQITPNPEKDTLLNTGGSDEGFYMAITYLNTIHLLNKEMPIEEKLKKTQALFPLMSTFQDESDPNLYKCLYREEDSRIMLLSELYFSQ